MFYTCTSLTYCHFESTNGSYFSVRSWPINGRQRKRSCSRRRLKSFHALHVSMNARMDVVFLQFKTIGEKTAPHKCKINRIFIKKKSPKEITV